HHPADARLEEFGDETPDEEIWNEPDPELPETLVAGIEVDKSRAQIAYRARPWWRGCRVKLGRFFVYAEAVEAVKAYFLERTGKWEPFRTKVWDRQRRTCCAVIRTEDGWCDLEWPKYIPPSTARKVARSIEGQTFKTNKAATMAFRSAIRRISMG